MQFWSKEFLAGMNVGSITIFFAWLILGQFAMLIVAVYILASIVQWWKKRNEPEPVFNSRPNSPFELIDGLESFGQEKTDSDQDSLA